jgi:WD40 repeat protein/DNA-binding SARP family transcriptional activator
MGLGSFEDMDVKLLGAVEATIDGRSIALGGGKPRALLALLALNAGSTVSVARLIDGLWGDEQPATAKKLVQLYVSQLRKALAAGGNGTAILTRPHGYELCAEPDEIDLGRFERLMAVGAPREALALWRGPPLDDVADEPFADAEIRRLEEVRLAAVEFAIEHDLEAGRHREVIGELEALVAAEPLRERLHAQRMLALYRCGRQADALEAYRQARTTLVETIGVEPGTELRRLHGAILRQDPSLELATAVDLPSELDTRTPLAGRDAELDRLRKLWSRAQRGAGRLVLVTGVRGIGKTRLAAGLAEQVNRDRGSVLYASAAGASDAALAALAGASAAPGPTLLVLDDLDRADAAVHSALDELAGRLRTLPVLVLATAEDAQVPADLTLRLAPLEAVAVRAVADVYAATDEEAAERLLQASGGIPEQVHRLAAEWARAAAARRLDASAGRAAAERAELRTAEDDLAGDVVRLQTLRERAEPRELAPEPVICPFKGLASFDVDDAGFFFGRERLVAEMVARLAGAPFMGIVGPSGSGKSSALRAGLLPALAGGVLPGSTGWALALLRPGEHPLRALELAIEDAGPRGLLLIAVDQFEEAFTACGDEHERAAFIDALLSSARDSRRRTRVLIAVRADYYGRCASYPELWRLLATTQAPVGPMTRDELRRAIELPARHAGLDVEPELVDALVADVVSEPGALPLLSTALLELWQQRDGRRMSLNAYRKSGGVRGAVGRMAERAYERLDLEQQTVARRILLRLAGEGEGDAVVRRPVSRAELDMEGAPEVLSVLADDRLITLDADEVEVAHEALLREWPRLRAWLDEDAQGRRLHRQLGAAAREWDTGGRDAGELYRGARLAAALDWSRSHDADLNRIERTFLDQSRAESERSTRRLRAVLVGVATLLALAVVAGLVALDQRGTARDEARAADAQRLGARALVERELDRAALLARQGVALDDSVQTRGNLLAALVKSPAALGVINRGPDAPIIQLSPDGKTLVVSDERGKLRFYDARTRQQRAGFELSRPKSGDVFGVMQLAYSPDGRRLAVAQRWAEEQPRVTVLDSRSRRPVARFEIPDREYDLMRYTADGRTLNLVMTDVNTDLGSNLIRHDARSGRRLGVSLPIGYGYYTAGTNVARGPLTLTPDGRRVVAAGSEETVVRDAATGRVVRRLPVGFDQASQAEVSADGHWLAVAGEEGALRLLDLRSGALRLADGPRDQPVERIAFAPDGRTVITGTTDGAIHIWDVRRAKVVETLTGHAGAVVQLAIAPDGSTLYSASRDGSTIVWDLAGSRRLGRDFHAGEQTSIFVRYSLSSDGRLLAVGQEDGGISIVDLRTLARRAPFRVATTPPVEGTAFVPGSHLLAVGDNAGAIALVDADSGRVLRRLHGHDDPVGSVGVSADGRLMITSSYKVVRLWSLPDLRPVGRPLRFDGFTDDAQLSPDGRFFLVVLDGRVELWDARKRRLIRRIAPEGGVEFFARYSPDGRLVALGLSAGTQVWSTTDWTPVTRTFAGQAGIAFSAAFSSDSRTLVTGSDDGALRLWDVETEQAVGAPLPGPTGHFAAPFFTPDDNAVIAGYDTGQAIRWDMRPASLIRRACRLAGRTLTREEWAEFLPGRDYDPACT